MSEIPIIIRSAATEKVRREMDGKIIVVMTLIASCMFGLIVFYSASHFLP